MTDCPINWKYAYNGSDPFHSAVKQVSNFMTNISIYYSVWLKGVGQVVGCRLQASSGRSGKQQQEQNSPNLAKAF